MQSIYHNLKLIKGAEVVYIFAHKELYIQTPHKISSVNIIGCWRPKTKREDQPS